MSKEELMEKSKEELIEKVLKMKERMHGGGKCACKCGSCAKCEGFKEEEKSAS